MRAIVGAKGDVPQRENQRKIFIQMLSLQRMMNAVVLRPYENGVKYAEANPEIHVNELQQEQLNER